MRLPAWLSPSRRAKRREARRQCNIMLEMMAGIGSAEENAR